MDDTAGVAGAFFSFTEVTDPAEHDAYNRWHQLDHLPQQYELPGIRFGQRWVSTPACAAARAVSKPPLDATHYVTLYLLAEPVGATVDAFMALGARLRKEGRFHEHRRAPLSGLFEVTGRWAAERVLVTPAVVPFRPQRGLYVAVAEGGAVRAPRAAEATGDDAVAGVWTFSARPDTARSGGVSRWPARDEQIVVCFLDGDPLEAAARLAPLAADALTGDVVFAGPLETVTPWRWDWFDPGPQPT